MKTIEWTWCPHCLDRENHDLIELRWICGSCGRINEIFEKNKPVTFEEFLKFIREHIGSYCNDSYWEGIYNKRIKKLSREKILKEIPFLGVNAVGTDYVDKNG